jgi:hypothetical protein
MFRRRRDVAWGFVDLIVTARQILRSAGMAAHSG